MHFIIGKISCTNCTNNIENKLKEAFTSLGLIEANANFMLKKLTVKIKNEAKNEILPENIVEILTEMGKECKFEYSEDLQEHHQSPRNSFKKIYSDNGSKLSSSL